MRFSASEYGPKSDTSRVVHCGGPDPGKNKFSIQTLSRFRPGRRQTTWCWNVFAKPEIYEGLEERGVKYAIPIPANDSLERDIEELLTRPVGRPSHVQVSN